MTTTYIITLGKNSYEVPEDVYREFIRMLGEHWKVGGA